MSKEISLNTKITFLETGDKYSISEQTPTGFQFKPIRFERGLPSVPRTFEEVKQEFSNKQIDIEGFEHNESDTRLVELIMDGYIKDGEITSLKDCATDLASQKGNLESLLVQKEEAIKSHEATISEQQDSILQQKGVVLGLNDEIAILKGNFTGIENLLHKEQQERATDKENWESEKQKFEATIEGLQAMAE